MKQLSEERTGLSVWWKEAGWRRLTRPEFWNPKVRGAECLNGQAARSILPIADLRTSMAGGPPLAFCVLCKGGDSRMRIPWIFVFFPNRSTLVSPRIRGIPAELQHRGLWLPSASKSQPCKVRKDGPPAQEIMPATTATVAAGCTGDQNRSAHVRSPM